MGRKGRVVWWLGIVLANLTRPAIAPAWEPHREIAKAAVEALPERARWEQALGRENLHEVLVDCSILPDLCYPFMAGAQWRVLPELTNARPLKSFYADDYVLIRALPQRVGHAVPQVSEAIEPHYWRTLQALRTETPVNACRQIGPLLHYIQDIGAPPHANPKCPHGIAMEVFRKMRAEEIIRIPGYQARLLGKTDQEARDGLRKRVEGLIAFSRQRADRGMAVWPDRDKLEPILLESALETARVCADVLYTMFTLGLAPQPEGAGLEGTVTAEAFPFYNDLGARVVLLNTDYCTLAVSSPQKSNGAGWQGTYRFRNLPAGTYHVLAYRTASQMQVSEPVTLEVGKVAKVDFPLAPTDPPGNIVENPDARLCTLGKDKPDRWQARSVGGQTIGTSTPAPVVAGTLYRCGAVLKDPKARVSFIFRATGELKEVRSVSGITNLADWLRLPPKEREGKGDYTWVPWGDPVSLTLAQGQTRPREQCFPAAEPYTAGVVVEVQTDKPTLAEAIERVWVVPVGPKGGP
ncbi:MAG: hypothetical protein NUV77_17965 [Thermoguttaceae bacterium]|jgi:hypothetical protein|nr:hypothetical protein [Thermoguttaceae bacterium]